MDSIPAGLHPVRTLLVNCHVLVDPAGRAVIIDTGFVGTRGMIRELLKRLHLSPSAVQAILLTHGHLDHAGNAAWLREWTGAPVYAHPAEDGHIRGKYPYCGVARICGALETIGRGVTAYRAAPIDVPLSDDDVLPFWGGLRVIHLPGHTLGHCGFWSEQHRLLFVGDLVAIGFWGTIYPPPIFNTAPQLLRESLRKACALQPRLVVPNHYRRFDPEYLARKLALFATKRG